MHEPQPLLRIRQRRFRSSMHSPDRGCRHSRTRLPLPLDGLTQSFDCRTLEQLAQPHLHSQHLAHSRDHLRRQQRVPPPPPPLTFLPARFSPAPQHPLHLSAVPFAHLPDRFRLYPTPPAPPHLPPHLPQPHSCRRAAHLLPQFHLLTHSPILDAAHHQ